MEFAYPVRVSEIVLDFVFSKDRLYFFHEIRGIRSHQLTRIWDIGDSEQILTLVQEKVNQIGCKLCGLNFRKEEIRHRVTYKLIYELVTHLKNRGEGVDRFSTGNIQPCNFSSSCHVCELCYSLVLAEHKLIDIEHQFCQILNISMDPLQRVPAEVPRARPSHHLMLKTINSGVREQTLTNNQLYQWRIFFYIEKIKNLPPEIDSFSEMALSMMCKGFSETFEKRVSEDSIKIQ